jgi:hemerythrin superfamily protein
MDAITLLTNDHRTVEALFKDYTFATADNVRKELVDQMVKELSIHAAIEEGSFYPKARELPDAKSLIDDGLEEHQKAKETLAKLDGMAPTDGQFAGLVQQLMKDIKHHVGEEEGELFPKVRAGMSMQDLERLGNEMAGMKATAPTHPHPHAPNEGAAAKMAGMAAGTADRLRDAASDRPDEREVRQDVQADRGNVHPPEQRLQR